MGGGGVRRHSSPAPLPTLGPRQVPVSPQGQPNPPPVPSVPGWVPSSPQGPAKSPSVSSVPGCVPPFLQDPAKFPHPAPAVSLRSFRIPLNPLPPNSLRTHLGPPSPRAPLNPTCPLSTQLCHPVPSGPVKSSPFPQRLAGSPPSPQTSLNPPPIPCPLSVQLGPAKSLFPLYAPGPFSLWKGERPSEVAAGLACEPQPRRHVLHAFADQQARAVGQNMACCPLAEEAHQSSYI